MVDVPPDRLHGDVDFRVNAAAALEVIRNAGEWLWANELTTSMWWHPDSLTVDGLADHASAEQMYAGFVDETPAVAAILQTQDSFGDWVAVDNAGPTQALYVHWLSVSRLFANKGLSDEMLGFAVELAQRSQLQCVRLDTNANNQKLCAIYERNGFDLIRVMPGDRVPVALYQLDLEPTASKYRLPR